MQGGLNRGELTKRTLFRCTIGVRRRTYCASAAEDAMTDFAPALISSRAQELIVAPFVTTPHFANNSVHFWTVWVESNGDSWQLKGILMGFHYFSGDVQPTKWPETFRLSQNYPNPFNPSTTIRFGVPMRSRVRLTVFNVLGQQVAQLADEIMNLGNFERAWGADVASGLYFYQIDNLSM